MDAANDINDKKRKSAAMEKEQATTLASELQELLAPLMGGEPLDLSLLASINLADTEQLNEREETALAHAAADHLALFQRHIGPHREVVGNGAIHVKNLWRDTTFCFHTGCDPVNRERYAFPRHNAVDGPRPDSCVWVGLFLGRDAKERMRQGLKEACESGDMEAYHSLRNALVDESTKLPVLELMRNILRYLREEAGRLPDATNLLRFCALYGLSGAIDNALSGKYGPVDGLTIDSLLPFKEHDAPKEKDLPFRFSFTSIFSYEDMFMPAWAFGAALGYRNVVCHSIQTLGAKTDTNLFWKMKATGEMQEMDSLPGLMLEWAIQTNQPEMVRCLVAECGFQFRWISNKLEEYFDLLFHVDRMGDEFGVWRSRNYNPDEHMFDRQSQRAYRARCCYEEKQHMLQTMIEVGLPRDLFIPQINVEVEKRIIQFMDDEGLVHGAKRSALKQFVDSLSDLESKARGHLFHAAAAYNSFQDEDEGDETLTLIDYYEKILGMWKNQPTVQEDRLSEFEKLDPRWSDYEEKGDEAFAVWWGGTSDEEDY